MPQQIGGRVLLSTSEAIKKSGLSRVHIQRLLRKGQLEGMKLGHDWLVFEDSVLAYIAQPHKTGPKGPRNKPVLNSSSGNDDRDAQSDRNNGSSV
ncbi:MAG TPA: helix-turn-helix domain-containing protein [Ktedonobacteraceae bacterium]